MWYASAFAALGSLDSLQPGWRTEETAMKDLHHLRQPSGNSEEDQGFQQVLRLQGWQQKVT